MKTPSGCHNSPLDNFSKPKTHVKSEMVRKLLEGLEIFGSARIDEIYFKLRLAAVENLNPVRGIH